MKLRAFPLIDLLVVIAHHCGGGFPRSKVRTTVLLIWLFGTNAFAYDEQRPISRSNPLRVSVVFTGASAPQVESSFRRGIRASDDVIIAEGKPDLRISVLLVEIKFGAGAGRIGGWGASVIALRPVHCCVFDNLTNVLYQSTNILDSPTSPTASRFLRLTKQFQEIEPKEAVAIESHQAGFIPVLAVKEACDLLTSQVDKDAFEGFRVAQQKFVDLVEKFKREPVEAREPGGNGLSGQNKGPKK